MHLWLPNGKGMGEGLETWHLFADSVVFKQNIYCSFFGWREGDYKFGHFLWMS